eukprot:scaffold16242_cov161-Skeletonema_marinoi.AAC.1
MEGVRALPVAYFILEDTLTYSFPPTLIQSTFNDTQYGRCRHCPMGRYKKQLGKQLSLYSMTIPLCAINFSPTRSLRSFLVRHATSTSIPIRCQRLLRRVERADFIAIQGHE